MTAEITFMPDDKSIQARPGTTVLDAARKARVHIRTRCSGKAACLMCKVRVTQGGDAGLTAMNVNERLKLGSLYDEGYRLACQAKLSGQGPVTVSVPEDPLKSAIRRQLEKQQEEEW
ncbi:MULTISPECIES: 2Fe-2S iron-sulfur cluster-binding protein [unclassified Paenibacillus]|uniref:2Fe-2S iron-sulfur cluster-binding protein n=1 Tax=unclassified Paenibacillus TaxID=185978 RepID=UPI001AEA93E3|nr:MULTISPECIES: 2Fe-2S iron-sulfur cluster-binding protein [unclassified Paenibacillus]MBP1155252.1 2Fe-2S ferredoxin [Paenibacillus sp. PvP091]MBP1169364.1 2Fe-2S ferredoxin [Paenibacillus sp. PvR098]MBP2440392.1 2Fe-2S ferredoxin [Paenibacillus sp. PvP052]